MPFCSAFQLHRGSRGGRERRKKWIWEQMAPLENGWRVWIKLKQNELYGLCFLFIFFYDWIGPWRLLPRDGSKSVVTRSAVLFIPMWIYKYFSLCCGIWGSVSSLLQHHSEHIAVVAAAILFRWHHVWLCGPFTQSQSPIGTRWSKCITRVITQTEWKWARKLLLLLIRGLQGNIIQPSNAIPSFRSRSKVW